MGWENPPVPWSELEGRLSDRGRARPFPSEGDGGDSPAWSYRRPAYTPPADLPRAGRRVVPYAELHCHSNFSFLDGASHPEELVEEAARLGLEALALTDHDGMYGVVRFAEAAREVGLPVVFGAELSLGLTRPQNGVADPEGTHLLVWPETRSATAGCAGLCRWATWRGGRKGVRWWTSMPWPPSGRVRCPTSPVSAALRRGLPLRGCPRRRVVTPITGWC
jgi:error-prone DNA polymerase